MLISKNLLIKIAFMGICYVTTPIDACRWHVPWRKIDVLLYQEYRDRGTRSQRQQQLGSIKEEN